ncbi:MAG: polyamine aminopropyltransferase [Elusimicrobia bacterium]|nr:polyamine aminopropyltransferase [Elusimicrobiota bacterium]
MTHSHDHSSNHYFKEWLTPHEVHGHHLKKILVKKKTKFQNAVVSDTYSFGRALILDGEMQSAQLDEFIYHEALIHPSLTSHPQPKTAAILGGGEGATLREILKHPTIEKSTMVDIDLEVIAFCKKYLKTWHQGSFENPKTEIVIGDAKKFIENSKNKFDIIISDLPSPMEKGPASQLYTIEFYKTLSSRLNSNGIFTLQAGSGNLLQLELHLKLYNTLKKIFPLVRSYSAFIPSFDVPWSFLFCSNSLKYDPFKISAKEIEERLKARNIKSLKFYDGMTHEGLFRIPKHLRTALEKEKGEISLKKPVYFYK